MEMTETQTSGISTLSESCLDSQEILSCESMAASGQHQSHCAEERLEDGERTEEKQSSQESTVSQGDAEVELQLFKTHSRNESPAPPNEASELNEMDTTFVNVRSEADLHRKDTEEVSTFVGEVSTQNELGDGPDDEREVSQESDHENNESGGSSDEEAEEFHAKAPKLSLPYKEPEDLSLREFLERRRSKKSIDMPTHTKEDPVPEPLPGSSSEAPIAVEEERPTQRKSKIHEEILKAAALVQPRLSVEVIADQPVDTLIKRAIVMQKAGQVSQETLDQRIPGKQLNDLKGKLSEKIREKRKKLREERRKRFEEKNGPQEEEEEEEDMTDEEYEDEETYLERAAEESEGEEVEGEPVPDEDEAVDENDEDAEDAEEGDVVGADQDEEANEVEDEEHGHEEEDSDIEELTEKRRSQKKRNAVSDSDDDGENGELVDEGDLEDGEENNSGNLYQEDLELKLVDDDDEEAQFMRLSQTQKKTQPAENRTSLSLDLVNGEDNGDVDDDLLALCSGNFATLKKTAKADEEPEMELPPKTGFDFFEDEAELSGSDDGEGDEDGDNMTEEEKRKLLKDLISENPGISEEELQDQVAKLHFKQIADDDRRELRLMKELLLADGELHADGPGRERSFKWTNLSNDFVGGNQNEDSDDTDQEETEEEAKWKARRLEREKQKEDEGVDYHVAPRKLTVTTNCELPKDVQISNILKEANKSLRLANPKKSDDTASVNRKSGGFLNMNNNVLQKIAEKVKGAVKDKEGSQTTKNFVFRTVDKPDNPTKSVKRPSSEQTDQMSAKKAKVTAQIKPSGSKSIFSKF